MGGKKQYQEETDESEEEEYEVQRIADHKIVYTGKKVIKRAYQMVNIR